MRFRGILVGGIALVALAAATTITIASLPAPTDGAVPGLAPLSISPTSTPGPAPTSDDGKWRNHTATPVAPATVQTVTPPATGGEPGDDNGGANGSGSSGGSGKGSGSSGGSGDGSTGSGKGGG
jgi:hypothetical protein